MNMKQSLQSQRKLTFESLIPELEQTLRESESAVLSGFASLPELIAMAEYVMQIRLALAGLKRATAREGCGPAKTFEDFEARFSLLEGRIKEMRNDRMV